MTDILKATSLNLIPGQLTLAQLRSLYQQPVTLSLDASDFQSSRPIGLTSASCSVCCGYINA